MRCVAFSLLGSLPEELPAELPVTVYKVLGKSSWVNSVKEISLISETESLVLGEMESMTERSELSLLCEISFEFETLSKISKWQAERIVRQATGKSIKILLMLYKQSTICICLSNLFSVEIIDEGVCNLNFHDASYGDGLC